MGSLTLPTIYFSKEDLKPGTQAWVSTCKQVCHALEEYGSFVAEFNKVSQDLRDTIFTTSEELFDLPLEVKKLNISDKPLRSYHCTKIIHESMCIENPDTIQGIQNFTNLMWPNGFDAFSESAHKMAQIMRELDRLVTKMVFEHYGVGKLYESHTETMEYSLKFSKYKEFEHIDGNIVSLPGHTDHTFSTLLLQSNVNGLEIQTKDGDWIVFDPPSHSSFIYNAGDAFMVWSNDRIRPCFHRVKIDGSKTRYSIALFTYNKGVIHTPDELVDDKHPLLYNPLDHLEYLRLLQWKLRGAAQKMYYPIKDHCGV
ncbi:2OG-FeII_Oxy domain-containing protein/DIOX_N domain-containing protein [Cephalotus follicularis]|uniref:2OG-FeII_Oxy domain-containing protein/DIOX_N domain-containing protein n=1 Tax=Cephalotus follicularis TaxID=3775 RepID=A0A1Q3D9S5_CEPFO|nr:2OG-FeII_Oxy domain-containing protein/DIOX_N domain-containing protein [Cephalotus follicularis]